MGKRVGKEKGMVLCCGKVLVVVCVVVMVGLEVGVVVKYG